MQDRGDPAEGLHFLLEMTPYLQSLKAGLATWSSIQGRLEMVVINRVVNVALVNMLLDDRPVKVTSGIVCDKE